MEPPRAWARALKAAASYLRTIADIKDHCPTLRYLPAALETAARGQTYNIWQHKQGVGGGMHYAPTSEGLTYIICDYNDAGPVETDAALLRDLQIAAFKEIIVNTRNTPGEPPATLTVVLVPPDAV